MKENYGGDPADKNRARSKGWPILIAVGGTGSQLLARLRGVRRLGKGKLGLLESIETAVEQGNAYKRWSKTATPVKRVQVWAESRPLMTVEPDELSNLKSFRFEVTSPQNAVIQIVKADEDDEPVVLRNLPVNAIPTCGLDETWGLPNGQLIRLVIVQLKKGRYDIMVAFAPKEDEAGLAEIPRPRAARAKAKAAGSRDTSDTRWDSGPAWIPQPLATKGAWVCAFVVLAFSVGAIGGFTGRGKSKDEVAGLRGFDRGEQLQPADTRSSTQNHVVPGEAMHEVKGPNAHVTVTVPEFIVAGGKNSACPKSGNDGDPKTEVSNSRPPVDTPPPAPSPKSQPDAARPSLVIGLDDHGAPRVFTSWNAQSLPKLARVRSVQVKMDESPPELAELDALHRSFMRVLKESSVWEVRDGNAPDKADAVLNLKFDPDKDCLGVVAINIADVEGKFIWQAYVSCQDLQKQGHEAMFADASRRLINTLQDTLKLSQSSAQEGHVSLDESTEFTADMGR